MGMRPPDCRPASVDSALTTASIVGPSAGHFVDSGAHRYTRPTAVDPPVPESLCDQTTCVAPRSEAFSRISFLAFSIPVPLAKPPQPELPVRSARNVHCCTSAGSASRTWRALVLRPVAQALRADTRTTDRVNIRMSADVTRPRNRSTQGGPCSASARCEAGAGLRVRQRRSGSTPLPTPTHMGP